MVIEGKELSLIYDISKDPATHALKDINISVGPGSFTGILGPSGSGKSSLLYVLSGLKKPSSGTVYYDDADIESYSRQQLDTIRKNRFGFIFQRHFLVDYMNVLDNVLAAANKSDKTAIELAYSLLGKLGIKHLASRKPFQLSGGQRQRAAVARALVNRPSVVFADEPTASLDHDNAREVMDTMESLRDEASLIVVTHDRTILENSDKILEMWDGRIVKEYK